MSGDLVNFCTAGGPSDIIIIKLYDIDAINIVDDESARRSFK